MKKIIEISPQSNGAHRNQSGEFDTLPDGWAVIPDGMETPNFPFGTITASNINGAMTITSWAAGAIPEPPVVVLTPTEIRELIYEKGTYESANYLVSYDGLAMTVDTANKLWLEYTAEGNTTKASAISAAIATTKETVRIAYPDAAT